MLSKEQLFLDGQLVRDVFPCYLKIVTSETSEYSQNPRVLEKFLNALHKIYKKAHSHGLRFKARMCYLNLLLSVFKDENGLVLSKNSNHLFCKKDLLAAYKKIKTSKRCVGHYKREIEYALEDTQQLIENDDDHEIMSMDIIKPMIFSKSILSQLSAMESTAEKFSKLKISN